MKDESHSTFIYFFVEYEHVPKLLNTVKVVVKYQSIILFIYIYILFCLLRVQFHQYSLYIVVDTAVVPRMYISLEYFTYHVYFVLTVIAVGRHFKEKQ